MAGNDDLKDVFGGYGKLEGTFSTVQTTDFLKTGVKYGRFGDTGDDPESMLLKRNQFMSGADAYAKGLGDRMIYAQYFDENMVAIKAPMKDDNGNVILPDTADGKFRKINSTWYDANIQALKEFEQRVDDEMEDRVFSDQLNAIVMGLPPKEYDKILGPKGGMDGMSQAMKDIDGRVISIRSTPQE